MFQCKSTSRCVSDIFRHLFGATKSNPCHEVCVEKCQVYGTNGIKMGAGGRKWHVRRAGGDPAKPPKLGTRNHEMVSMWW